MNKSGVPSEFTPTSTVSERPSTTAGMADSNRAIINMPGRDSGRKIPHSYEYGDTYVDNGTCYTEVAKRPWEDLPELLDASSTMPYLTHVKRLSKVWPTLRHLVDFMEVGTSPLQWRYLKHKETERVERVKRTEITFIEYKPAMEPKTEHIDSTAMLTAKLKSLAHDAGNKPPLRLFIVEDLSREVIETLGGWFDIDPLFFREHIEDYVWHNTRDPWAMPPPLTTSTRQRSWFRVRNMRLRYHKTQKSFEDARWDANDWNVIRRPDDDKNHWAHKDEVCKDEKGKEDKAVVSIMRTRTTTWIGKDRRCGDGTVGIILLDPTLKEGKPLWHDRSNWLPTTSMEVSTPKIKLSSSWYQDIVQMTAAYPWFKQEVGHGIKPQVLAYPTLYTICAEWLLVCDYVKTRLSQIEWEVELPKTFRRPADDTRSKSDVIADSLQRLHTWRRHIPVFRDMVTEALDQALPAVVRLTSHLHGDEAAAKALDEVKPDFERVLKSLEELQDRVNNLTGVVTSEINLNDSHQAIEDNHNLTRLTWLATIFIPLSFVSAFFSMNESVADLKYTYGWFFVTAIPFTALCLVIAQLSGDGWLGRKIKQKANSKKAMEDHTEGSGTSFYYKHIKLT